MKHFHIGLVFLIINTSVFGQDSAVTKDSSTFRYVLGFNTGKFLNGFLGDGSTSYSNYFLNYRMKFGQKALRFGLGGDFSKSNHYEPNSGSGYNNVKYQRSEDFSIVSSLGFEWLKPIGQRWEFYYGLDIVSRWGSRKSKAIKTNYSNLEYEENYRSKFISVGIGGLLGINFMINNRIYLGTETNFIVNYFISEGNSYYSSGFSSTTGIKNEIIYPRQLWLYIKF